MKFCDQKRLALSLLGLLLHWRMPHTRPAASPRAAAAMEEATRTSRAALRLGTAGVVKRSVNLDCVSVSPLGFVVISVPASLGPPKTA